jgi:hypothetical protein
MMRTTHRVTILALVSALLGAFLSTAAVSPASAASATRCQKGSNMEGGRCWTRSTIYKHLKVAEAVPLENLSSRTITAHCQFSRTITKTFTGGVDLNYNAKASILGLVDVGTSYTLHMSVSQSAAQATEAGASVVLRPGQRVTCQRTYGYVSTRIKDYRYWGSTGAHAGSSTTYYTVTVPAYLGVRVVD